MTIKYMWKESWANPNIPQQLILLLRICICIPTYMQIKKLIFRTKFAIQFFVETLYIYTAVSCQFAVARLASSLLRRYRL